MKIRYAKSVLWTGSALSALCAAPALALEAHQPADAAQPSTQRDEQSNGDDIVVTARRTEERIQDVPISIAVFSQEQLSERNISSGRDLAAFTPALQANTRFGNDFASFAIRGFTQEARTTPSVGVYFADAVVPRGSPSAASGDGAGPGYFFDLQNVQVLRGPQGTLFGRNTTGGAVVLVPQRPTDNFEGYVEGSYGNYDMRRVQAVVNIPVSDSFRIRAGVDRQLRDGYLRNIGGVGPSTFADVDYIAARFSAIAELSPNVENYTVIQYQYSNNNGPASRITDCYAGSAARITTDGPNVFACQQIARERNAGDLYVNNTVPFAFQQSQVWQLVNTFRVQLNDHLTLRSISSYGEIQSAQAVDLFGLSVPLGATLTVPVTTAPFFRTQNVPARLQGLSFGSDTSISPPGGNASSQATLSQEFQFQGDAAGNRLRYQFGLYYERSMPNGFSGTQSFGGVICGVSAPAYVEFSNNACTDQAAATGAASAAGSRNYQVVQINYRNMAAYAQASFDILPNLTLDAGIRYTVDRTFGDIRQVVFNTSAASGFVTPIPICFNPALTYRTSAADCQESFRQESEAPTWLIGLNWRPIESILLYAKYSRGYRQGAIQPFAATGFKEYEPEQVDVYEGGIRASWRGPVPGSLNVSGYYNDFTNQQLQVSFVDTNGIAPNLQSAAAIVNAGSSRIYGLEVEGQIRPFRGFTVQASYAYINTRLTTFTQPDLSTQPVGGYNVVASTPFAGDRLVGTPEHKFSIAANYELPLPESVGRITIGGSYVYTGDIFYGRDLTIDRRVTSVFAPTDPNYSTSIAPAVGLLNLNVSWDHVFQLPIDAQFFMTNVTDERYYEGRSLSGSRGFTNRYYGEPQMYGVRLRYNFGG